MADQMDVFFAHTALDGIFGLGFASIAQGTNYTFMNQLVDQGYIPAQQFMITHGKDKQNHLFLGGVDPDRQHQTVQWHKLYEGGRVQEWTVLSNEVTLEVKGHKVASVARQRIRSGHYTT